MSGNSDASESSTRTVTCPNCGLENEIESDFRGEIVCKYCKKELYVSGTGDAKKVELYETSLRGKLKRLFR